MTCHLDTEEAGFTLLELLAVLVIIGIAAAFTVPKVGHLPASTAIHSAAIALVSEFRTARIDAISTSTPRTVTIDPSQKSYWDAGDGKAHRLPSGVGVSASSGSFPPSLDRASIVFAPDGSSSGARVDLNAGNSKAHVVVDWMTGAAQVEWGF